MIDPQPQDPTPSETLHISETCLVFDFDGVLCDTIPFKSKAFELWARSVEPSAAAAFMHYHYGAYGIGRKLQVEHFFREILRKPADDARIAHEVGELSTINRELVFQAPLFPDVKPFLAKARCEGRLLYVLSGTPEGELLELIDYHQLSAFFTKALGTPVKKPDGLSIILRETGVLPGEMAFFGDAPADLLAAEAVGCRFIYRPSQARFDLLPPLHSCNSFEHIRL